MMIRLLGTALLTLTACGGAAPTPAAMTADPSTTGAITGAVRDKASAQALSFATVTAASPDTDEPPTHTDTTDAHGGFAIEGLAPGTYRVHVYYANVSARWQDVTVRAGERVELSIDLSLVDDRPPAPVASAQRFAATRTEAAARGGHGTITGTVLDQVTGEPLEGAVVAATTPGLRDAQMAVADENGEYHIAALPPGRYKLSCYYRLIDYGDIEVQRTNIEVAAGAMTTVPLRLDTSATLGP